MKTIERIGIAAALAVALSAQAAQGEEAAARLEASLKARYPQTAFAKVEPTEVPGLFAVTMGANVAYVSEQAPRYFLFGRLFDTEKMRDLTADKLARAAPQAEQAQQVDFAALPLADAIKTVRGKGTRVLVVFADPACGYCRRLEPELAQIDDATIYTFLLPFQGERLPKAIWCAPDRGQAWADTMLKDQPPGEGATSGCETPLARNVDLAHRLGVTGTPVIVFADGTRLIGAATREEIEGRLAAAQRPAQAAASKE